MFNNEAIAILQTIFDEMTLADSALLTVFDAMFYLQTGKFPLLRAKRDDLEAN